jgi:hypothetical protein
MLKNPHLPSKEDELRRFFFIQSMAKSAIGFASMESQNEHMVVRLKVGEAAPSGPVFLSHLNHTDQMDLKRHNGYIVVDLKVQTESMLALSHGERPWDNILVLTDALGNRHYLSHACEIYYYPDVPDPNKKVSCIELVPWGLDATCAEGDLSIEEMLER